MSESQDKQYSTLVGIGCGRTIHSKQLPIDLAIYLKGADLIRKQHLGAESNERGVIVVADEELATQDIDPAELVAFRTERIRKTMEVLQLTDWDIVFQSQIKRSKLPNISIEGGLEALPEADFRYLLREVDDGDKLIAQYGEKIGWVRDLSRLIGGEKIYDEQIARLRPDISFRYHVERTERHQKPYPRLIGVPLSSSKGEIKPPYLTKKPEEHMRLCLPADGSQLERELEKLDRTPPSGLAKARIKDFCWLVRTSLNLTLSRGENHSLVDQLKSAYEPFLR